MIANNLAIIPVKEKSTRIPNKNFMLFDDLPIFVRVYKVLKKTNLFKKIIISTDSKKIIKICKSYNIQNFSLRPEHLLKSNTSLNDICYNVIKEEIINNKKYDYLCMVWATALMLESKDLKKAYKLLIKNKKVNGLVGISRTYEYYPSLVIDNNNYLKQLYDKTIITRMNTQDYPETFVDNGQMAWSKIKVFMREKNWMPKKSVGLIMPKNKSVDLDNLDDLKILKYYYNENKLKKNKIDKMTKVFFDTEFTRGGQNTSLISIGFVSENDEKLYIELNDYDKTQVDKWLKKNIMNLLDNQIKYNSSQAAKKIEKWFKKISKNKKIQLISAGKEVDNILLYNLWSKKSNNNTLRSWMNKLPKQINHKFHIDLDTLFVLNNVDPSIDKYLFSGFKKKIKIHKSIDDAKIIKECWNNLTIK